ncbi:partial Epoxide hydrolase A, partial [Anaerolineae bacterium]
VYQGKVSPEVVELYVRRLSEPGALTAAFNWYRALEPGIRLVPLAGRIEVPTLYIWSTEDMACGSVAAHATEAWVDAPYRFEVLEGRSHWVTHECAAETNRLLLEHLGQRS